YERRRPGRDPLDVREFQDPGRQQNPCTQHDVRALLYSLHHAHLLLQQRHFRAIESCGRLKAARTSARPSQAMTARVMALSRANADTHGDMRPASRRTILTA